MSDSAPNPQSFCLKHPGQEITNYCLVCSKPLCPKCMELFGFVCSPLCRNEAESSGIEIPAYSGQTSALQAAGWRKFRLVAWTLVTCIIALGAFAVYYATVLSKPHPVFTVAFKEASSRGSVQFIGSNDAVVLHGRDVRRYDLRKEKVAWQSSIDAHAGVPTRMWVRGGNVWIGTERSLLRFDGKTGELAESFGAGHLIERPDELLLIGSTETNRVATLLAMESGQLVEQQEWTGREIATGNSKAAGPLDRFRTQRGPSLTERLAAPATAASVVHNQRVEDAAEDRPGTSAKPKDASGTSITAASGKVLLVRVRTVEPKWIERTAMKESGALLEKGEATASSSLEVANELFNDFQRERTGGVELVDVSRYAVSLERPGAERPEWQGEVTGPPRFIGLKTVSVIVAGRSLVALDESFRPAWQAQLEHELGDSSTVWSSPQASVEAVAMERGNVIYLRDAGALTCFDSSTGDVRWRLNGVAISHVVFDGTTLYVQMTTAPLDSLKYSQQIDVSRRDPPLLLKLAAATGKVLWQAENNGHVAHASDDYLYTLEWEGGAREKGAGLKLPQGQSAVHTRIRRLAPDTGEMLWEHTDPRGAVDVSFARNQIQLLFPDALEVLSYSTLFN